MRDGLCYGCFISAEAEIVHGTAHAVKQTATQIPDKTLSLLEDRARQERAYGNTLLFVAFSKADYEKILKSYVSAEETI